MHNHVRYHARVHTLPLTQHKSRRRRGPLSLELKSSKVVHGELGRAAASFACLLFVWVCSAVPRKGSLGLLDLCAHDLVRVRVRVRRVRARIRVRVRVGVGVGVRLRALGLGLGLGPGLASAALTRSKSG